jgi:hypothetical protein
VDVDAFPDLATLGDAELKALVERKIEEERAVSRRRRELHAELDRLRAERVRRLRAQYSSAAIADDESD